MMRILLPITVPSSIRPLPFDQRLGKLHNPRVFREIQPATHCQRVTFLRRTSPISSIDLRNIAKMSLTQQPFQNKIRCLNRWPKSWGYSEFDKRDETPVCACPLLVWMDPETTIDPLPREKSLDNMPARNLFLRRENFLRVRRSVHNLCESEITDRGIIRFQKPVDCRILEDHTLILSIAELLGYFKLTASTIFNTHRI